MLKQVVSAKFWNQICNQMPNGPRWCQRKKNTVHPVLYTHSCLVQKFRILSWSGEIFYSYVESPILTNFASISKTEMPEKCNKGECLTQWEKRELRMLQKYVIEQLEKSVHYNNVIAVSQFSKFLRIKNRGRRFLYRNNWLNDIKSG